MREERGTELYQISNCKMQNDKSKIKSESKINYREKTEDTETTEEIH